MATAFKRKGSRLVASFDADELGVVTELLRLTRAFVAPEREETGDPFLDLIAGLGEHDADPAEPSDPALRRLLPPAHRSDTEQAAEFRRLTEHTLRSRKAATIASALEALDGQTPPAVVLDLGQAQALAVALTDVRLILGERLGLRTDEDAEVLHQRLNDAVSGDPADADPALLQQMAYYDFLTWMQESLTLALMR